MSVSFKKFVELVDQEDVTDEQINELFGFGDDKKKQADIAKQKSDEFKARRDALRKKMSGQSDDDESDEDEDSAPKNQQGARPAQAVRPAQSAAQRQAAQRQGNQSGNRAADIRSANSAHRTGQVDWATESLKSGRVLLKK